MKDYYTELIEKNNDLILDIYNKMLENNLFVKKKDSKDYLTQKRFSFPLNPSHNNEEKVSILSTYTEINITVELKEMSINLYWPLGDLKKKEKNKFFKFEGFRKPDMIEVSKNSEENDVVKSIIYLYEGFGISFSLFSVNGAKTDMTLLTAWIKEKINFLEHSGNEDTRNKLKTHCQFARELSNSKLIENNLSLLSNYLCEGENFSDSFKELLLLESDIKSKDIDSLIRFMPNINLFSERIAEIYNKKELKNIKNKLQGKNEKLL